MRPACARCRQPIAGAFRQVGGLRFHPEHFTCRGCGRPIAGPYETRLGAFFHPACEVAPPPPSSPIPDHLASLLGMVVDQRDVEPPAATLACEACREPIAGAYRVDDLGRSFHERHVAEHGLCFFCDRLLHPGFGGGKRRPDGAVACRECTAASVWDEAEVRRLAFGVQRAMAAWGVDLGERPIPVRVGRREQLASLVRGRHLWLFGVAEPPRPGFPGRVNLIAGLPLPLLEGVAAHELMHVWNAANGPPHAHLLEEGSAELMCHRMMAERAHPLAARYLHKLATDDRAESYGGGFRTARRYVERRGLEGLLQLLRVARDFPSREAMS